MIAKPLVKVIAKEFTTEAYRGQFRHYDNAERSNITVKRPACRRKV